MASKKVLGACDGATLRRFREVHKASGPEISALFGRNRGWCSQVETGRSALSESDAIAICRAYDEDVAFFGLDASNGPKVFDVQRVQRRLYELGWSWREFAKLIGVSPQTVYRWKNDAAQPLEAHVELIAETLEVSVESLWTAGAPTELVAPDARKALVEFTEAEWRRVSQAVKALLGRNPKVTLGA